MNHGILSSLPLFVQCTILSEWIGVNKSMQSQKSDSAHSEMEYKVIAGQEVLTFLASKGFSEPNLPAFRV